VDAKSENLFYSLPQTGFQFSSGTFLKFVMLPKLRWKTRFANFSAAASAISSSCRKPWICSLKATFDDYNESSEGGSKPCPSGCQLGEFKSVPATDRRRSDEVALERRAPTNSDTTASVEMATAGFLFGARLTFDCSTRWI
jgi:hypothetical protein